MIDHGEPVSQWPYLYKVQFGALLVDEKTAPGRIGERRRGRGYGIVMDMDTRAENFVCRRCGACCRVPGVVRVDAEDVDRLAAALGMTVEAFTERFTELAPGRTGLMLAGDPEGPCIFLGEDNLCREYPARWRSAAIEAVCEAERIQA